MNNQRESIHARLRGSANVINKIPIGQTFNVYQALDAQREIGLPVWVMGNGGSLSNAQHLVLHLRQAGFEVIDLMSDPAWLSAESNDRGYHGAIVRGFDHYRSPGAIILISGSGNSLNCLDIARHFKRPEFVSGPEIVGLLGMGGGRLKEFCSASVTVPSDEYAEIEDAHAAIIHAVVNELGAPVYGPMSENLT